MTKQFFVTGTDTEVGKTYTTCRLMEHYAAQGLSVLGLKPIAAGGDAPEHPGQNDDALQLQQASTLKLDYAAINPFFLPDPCSPNIAATRAGKSISVAEIVAAIAPALAKKTDYTFVEGAGGWFVPINSHETMAQVAQALQLPVLLVVDIKLGCINHALLSAQAILHSGLPLAGWIANDLSQDTLYRDEIIATMTTFLGTPPIETLNTPLTDLKLDKMPISNNT